MHWKRLRVAQCGRATVEYEVAASNPLLCSRHINLHSKRDGGEEDCQMMMMMMMITHKLSY